ncbi:Hypothetical protein NCS54_00896700 [Fusarium falciforme]|uniref:Hypothetical protein n=1 Tax=Fusarium falciforme TaxID=195108 RepID=UPI0022FFFAD1|nr:Hypothetical protein NCS54_00896700 [Fusarium falciforme]WAO91492.1 Hypothetical protein NCS54_00896700 [Fusarium falciforme]
MDTANAQLGIWVAAWHQRLRSIINLGGGTERIITVPVIQVVGSVWTLLFVTDAGPEISSWTTQLANPRQINNPDI